MTNALFTVSSAGAAGVSASGGGDAGVSCAVVPAAADAVGSAGVVGVCSAVAVVACSAADDRLRLPSALPGKLLSSAVRFMPGADSMEGRRPVSYTHLTLPTKLEV